MKGWIKVHSNCDKELYFRASDIMGVYSELDQTTIVTCSCNEWCIGETVDEVLALIEEAEKKADTEEE